MRYKDGINIAHYMKSICHAALLKDNAPEDLELYRTWVRVTEEHDNIFAHYTSYQSQYDIL